MKVMMEVVLEINTTKTWLKYVSEEIEAEIRLLECIPDRYLDGYLLFEIDTKSENVS
jgi:hypothetical protein